MILSAGQPAQTKFGLQPFQGHFNSIRNTLTHRIDASLGVSMVRGVTGKAGISGPCVACGRIVSFKAPSCLHCGHPNAGQEAKTAAKAKAAAAEAKAAAAEAKAVALKANRTCLFNIIKANAEAKAVALKANRTCLFNIIKANAEAQAVALVKVIPWGSDPSDSNNKKIEKAILHGIFGNNHGRYADDLTTADLEKVTRLTSLNLKHKSLTSVKGLEKLTQLKTLSLVRNELTDVKGLENLTQLKGLDLDGNKLTSVKGLEKLMKLTVLRLGRSWVHQFTLKVQQHNNQLTNVKGLEKLTQLKELFLQGNQLTDVKGLEKLTQLTRLDLSDNKLTSVKGLEELTQLTKLNLHGNKLTSVKGLEKLTGLKELWLAGNPDLTKAQIAELHKALPKCVIGSDHKMPKNTLAVLIEKTLGASRMPLENLISNDSWVLILRPAILMICLVCLYGSSCGEFLPGGGFILEWLEDREEYWYIWWF